MMARSEKTVRDERWKWLYTFVLLIFTLLWAAYCVETVRNVVMSPDAAGVLEASGTSVVLGALIAWNGNVNQYWFRKRPGDSDVPPKPPALPSP